MSKEHGSYNIVLMNCEMLRPYIFSNSIVVVIVGGGLGREEGKNQRMKIMRVGNIRCKGKRERGEGERDPEGGSRGGVTGGEATP